MITILIPTKNRSEFVARALHYYASVGFDGYICLGDSSNEEHANKIQATIQRLEGKLNVLYRYYPSPPYRNDAMCLKEMIEEVPTEYAVYAGDDDFVIPKTLKSCVDFLASHPDYSAAHGTSIVVFFAAQGAHGEVRRIEAMLGHSLHSESAFERWKGYMRHALSTQYYVHRTATWRQMYQHLNEVPTRYLGTEVMPCSFSALTGKIKELDGLSCLFQVNEIKEFGWGTHSMYSLAMEPDWSRSIQGLRTLITQELETRDKLSPDKALKQFDKEFWRHIMILMEAHYDMRYEPTNPFSAFKRRYPQLIHWIRIARQLTTRRYDVLSLPKLLDSAHRYHADFMPAYQAIITPHS